MAASGVDPAAADTGIADTGIADTGVANPVTAASEPPEGLATGSTRPAAEALAPGDADALPLVEVQRRYYAVEREIARGGMGRVLVARDRRLARTVAIKELLVDDAAMRARFEREARITARLQHPATVALIEAGTWPGGSPFIAMNLVIGEPLEKVISAHRSLASRLALIPNVIAAGDALAYAHDHRIIHRDLKPANVLVGRYGQTIVVDWGLAKDLTSPADDVPGATRGGQHAVETVVGTVMGTPAYMPPEQADGATVDERADVYALGALLYHVLAGAPPYTGRTADAVLDAVLHGSPRPLAAVVPDVPPELVTIVDKAMARDPAGRYANAGELVRELKQFQTGAVVGSHRYSVGELARRWLRKHRTAVAIGAVAAVVVAVVSIASLLRVFDARRHAEAAQRVAEQRRVDADKLLDFMVGDLKPKLMAVGKLDMLGAVADKAAGYFDARSTDTPDARLRQFRAWLDLGDVTAARGDDPGALVHYDRALALALQMLAFDDRGYESMLDMAEALAATASIRMAQGDSGAGAALLAQQRALLQHVLDGDPTNDRALAAMIKNLDEQATLAGAAGDRDGELAHLRAARELALLRTRRAPRDWIVQVDLIGLRVHLADAFIAAGKVEPALDELRTAAGEGDHLASIDPDNAEWLHVRVVAYNKLGEALSRAGDRSHADLTRETALKLAEKLAAHDPANIEWQRLLLISNDGVADAQARHGNLNDAIARVRKSQAIAMHVLDLDGTNATSQRDLSVNHVKLAHLLRATGDLTAAQHELEAGMAIAQVLATADPASVARQRDAAITFTELGDVLLARKDVAGALTRFRAGHAIIERLAADSPDDVHLQRTLSIDHEKIGDALLAAGKRNEALVEYRTSLELARKLSDTDPANAGWSRDVLDVTTLVADTLADAGAAKSAEARAAYADALAIADRLLRADPGDTDLKAARSELAKKRTRCCKQPKRH